MLDSLQGGKIPGGSILSVAQQKLQTFDLKAQQLSKSQKVMIHRNFQETDH